ncbi:MULTISPECIES: hypothetical protein [Streptomyces]|uniref:hypothetical protein n=1 Tax=Streptomyces TaxID=1883 RepID=UPI0018DF2067|nr:MULTISPECIES: hypothetical protein [Streptomyces]MCZ4101750.1 hypothetical protein [Streptomyces sp. H39-C1]
MSDAPAIGEVAHIADRLRVQCAQELDARESGYFHQRAWLRTAFLTVPRENVVPEQVWWPHPRDDGLHHVINRGQHPRAWIKSDLAGKQAKGLGGRVEGPWCHGTRAPKDGKHHLPTPILRRPTVSAPDR